MAILQQRYKQEIRPALIKKRGYSNVMCVPVLEKVVVSMGIAKQLSKDKNLLQDFLEELAVITGQKPIVLNARQSISNFKLREGQPVGIKVTLRNKRMWDFVYKFINIITPRIRDFRGFSKKGDGRGCYHIGIKDHQVFPELNLDKVRTEKGMNIAFVTTAETPEECIELLTQMGMPFKKDSTGRNNHGAV